MKKMKKMKTMKNRKYKYHGGNKNNKNNKKTIKKHVNKSVNKNVISDKYINEQMKKEQCSPLSMQNEKNGKKTKKGSCLSDDALFKLRDVWNARHPDINIKTNDPIEIWNKLYFYMKNTCNKESCWLKQNFANDDKYLKNELTKSFAPEYPKEWRKDPNKWLSSIDILNVMKQYEEAYKCFTFIGPSPIDYDTHMLYGECVWEELCHFNLQNEIDSGKTKIGIIFNLDPHYKGGSHWVSMFINIKKKSIFYFDSAGEKIPKQIDKFVQMVIDQGKTLPSTKRIDFVFDQNYPVEHQYGNTECGIYSLFFIVHMLEDKITSYYLKNHILKDQYMEKFRKIYFNNA